jgi:radical SAM protein with 4Fe4S-binding SPASM domain
MYSPLRFVPRIFFKRSAVHFTLFVTRRCNARCSFCFYVHGGGQAGDELTVAEVERFAPYIGTLLWLAFSGGEIFLREDLPDLSAVLYRATRPSFMVYPTNGLMPEKIADALGAILKTCTRSSIVVKLSLDGLGAEHDRIRGVPGAFDRVRMSYERLASLADIHPNLELGINTVFMASNQDRMDEVIDFVHGMRGVRTHTISMVRGEVGNPAEREIDLGLYLRAIERLEREGRAGGSATYGFRGARLKAAQDIVQRETILRTAHEGRRQIPCYAGDLNIVMTETGDVYPCESFSPGMLLGNIRVAGYDLGRIVKGDRMRSLREHIRERCFCTHECFTMTNLLFNPLVYRRLLREYWRFGKNVV